MFCPAQVRIERAVIANLATAGKQGQSRGHVSAGGERWKLNAMVQGKLSTHVVVN